MNILILKPKSRSFYYSLFSEDGNEIVSLTKAENFKGFESEWSEHFELLESIRQNCTRKSGRSVNAVVFRVLFGGEEFPEPVIADNEAISKLEALIPQAPLHLPGTLQLISCSREVFGNVPVVLLFETALFSDMPLCESIYGIDPQLSDEMNLRRFGYHGIYHQAGCQMAKSNLSGQNSDSDCCILSICLESQPELAAVKGYRVMMVTSGTTPLKGIPGENNCGLIDPSIVLTLSEKMGWGPEKINSVLTRQSGLSAPVGRNTDLSEILESKSSDVEFAYKVFAYRMLNACGAGIAAMGDVDAIVFSGKYAKSAGKLADYLKENLIKALNCKKEIRCFFLEDKLDRLMLQLSLGLLNAYFAEQTDDSK